MASFTAGTTFVDGVSNDVTAAKLGTLVTNATPTSGFIQDRTAETVVGTDDTILIGDASDSNNLKRMTVANILKAPLVSTSGTIDSLTTGTTTSTNQIVTNGTITNLSATTSTFLGAITGSTNVVNIGSGQIYKDASGLVGIGTTSPASKLHVLTPSPTSANEVARFQGGSNSSNFRNYISLYTTNPDYWWELSNQDASGGAAVNGLAFRERSSTYGTASIERLYIASGGNVGIGTTSPSTKLDVLCSPNAGIRVTDGTQVGIVYASGVGGIVAGTTSTHPYILYSNNTERLRIDSSGNVGVGTTSPAAKLHVYNTNTYAGKLTFGGVTATGTVLNNEATDNVYSEYALGTWNLTRAKIRSEAGSGGGDGVGGGVLTLWTGNSSGVQTERLRIDSSGNVGIGVAAPVNKLEVVGSFGRGAPVTKTGDFTLADTENWLIVNKGSSCTVTLPSASSWTGREFTIKVITAHTVVSASSNIVPRNSATAGTAILAAAAGNWATLVSNGTAWVIMCGS